MTAPRSRDERLNELVSIVNGIRWGMPGYDARLVEMSAGFPGGSGGGGSKGSVSRPIEAQLGLNTKPPKSGEKEDPRWGLNDPAAEAQREFERHLEATLERAEQLWDTYKRMSVSRVGVEKITDPGCELCAQVPCGGTMCARKGEGPYRCQGVDDHWCPTFATVERTIVSKRKGQPDTVVKVRVCSSCYEFQRPDRANRLPTHDEVLDHVEGRRRRWKVGA